MDLNGPIQSWTDKKQLDDFRVSSVGNPEFCNVGFRTMRGSMRNTRVKLYPTT